MGVALGLKALFLVTTVAGITGVWPAVLADTGATVLVTLNSLRLLGLNDDQGSSGISRAPLRLHRRALLPWQRYTPPYLVAAPRYGSSEPFGGRRISKEDRRSRRELNLVLLAWSISKDNSLSVRRRASHHLLVPARHPTFR